MSDPVSKTSIMCSGTKSEDGSGGDADGSDGSS